MFQKFNGLGMRTMLQTSSWGRFWGESGSIIGDPQKTSIEVILNAKKKFKIGWTSQKLLKFLKNLETSAPLVAYILHLSAFPITNSISNL